MLDIIDSILQIAIPLAQIRHKQMPHQRLGITIKPFGEMQLPLEYILINNHRIIIRKRINPCYHLIDDNP